MKKLSFLLAIAVLFGVWFFSLPVKAEYGVDDYSVDTMKQLSATAGEQGANYGLARDPRAMVAQVVKIIMGLMGILFTAYTVYAGFLILASGGNEEKITKGKKVIFYAVLGTIISFSAYGLALFAERYLAGNAGGVSGSVESGGWYAEAGISVDQDTSQFYNSDPQQQSTQLFQ